MALLPVAGPCFTTRCAQRAAGPAWALLGSLPAQAADETRPHRGAAHSGLRAAPARHELRPLVHTLPGVDAQALPGAINPFVNARASATNEQRRQPYVATGALVTGDGEGARARFPVSVDRAAW